MAGVAYKAKNHPIAIAKKPSMNRRLILQFNFSCFDNLAFITMRDASQIRAIAAIEISPTIPIVLATSWLLTNLASTHLENKAVWKPEITLAPTSSNPPTSFLFQFIC